MFELQAEDRQRIAISWAMSIGITIAMLGLFFFIRLNSSVPKVEPMELFVEVNYGTSKVGKGDIQTFNKPSNSKVRENMRAEAEEVKESEICFPAKTNTSDTSKSRICKAYQNGGGESYYFKSGKSC